jgi:nitrite reductase/ring-hydroxylating ferredoxin subunit
VPLRFRVCRMNDVPVGEMRGFAVAGLPDPILVANVDGRLHATASICPHEDVSLLDGTLVAARVVCPGHGYAFDVATGRCTHDAGLRLPRHRVELVGDEVFVELVGVPDHR